jgi:hypothetical protein
VESPQVYSRLFPAGVWLGSIVALFSLKCARLGLEGAAVRGFLEAARFRGAGSEDSASAAEALSTLSGAVLRWSELLGVVWLGFALMGLAAALLCFQRETRSPKTAVALLVGFLLCVCVSFGIAA